jgi:hypothetical protein
MPRNQRTNLLMFIGETVAARSIEVLAGIFVAGC